MAKKEKTKEKYKDFIEFEPEVLTFLTKEQTELAVAYKYKRIIIALRKKHMTPKEIHDLFVDEETKKHTVTIKTIYRYLELLEEKGLIKVSGHRITEGKRLTEKLYARTANIFFKYSEDKTQPMAAKKRKTIIENLYIILEQISKAPIIDYEEFEKIIDSFMDYEDKYIRHIVKQVPTKKTLKEMYGKLDMDLINLLDEFAARLLILVKHPELVEKIQKIFSESRK